MILRPVRPWQGLFLRYFVDFSDMADYNNYICASSKYLTGYDGQKAEDTA